MEKTKCFKCEFESEDNLKKFGTDICLICNCFAPENIDKFKEYINEKIPFEVLNTFRKNFQAKGIAQKKGMIFKASKGEIMSRPPFGYQIKEGKLILGENSDEVRQIFEEFLSSEISLRKLSEKHNLSVNGLKKILRNFSYIGKVKFNNQIHEGTHPQIISPILFNHVQNKLEKLKIKKS